MKHNLIKTVENQHKNDPIIHNHTLIENNQSTKPIY